MDPIPQVDDKGSVLGSTARPAPPPPTPSSVLGQPDSLHHHNTPPPPHLFHLPAPSNPARPLWLITKIEGSLLMFFMMNSYI